MIINQWLLSHDYPPGTKVTIKEGGEFFDYSNNLKSRWCTKLFSQKFTNEAVVTQLLVWNTGYAFNAVMDGIGNILLPTTSVK